MTRTLFSLTAFAVAVYSFSGLWSAFRSAWDGRPTLAPGPFLAYVAVLVLSLGYLAFILYAAESARGGVRRRIGAFDRLLNRERHG